jgi:pyruvate kinase
MCINYTTLYDNICKYTLRPISSQEAMCASAVKTAVDLNCSLIIVLTESGYTARKIAKYRPKQRVLALSANTASIRNMNLNRGVWGIKVPTYVGTENLIMDAIKIAVEKGYAKKDDRVVCVLGHHEENSAFTNVMKIATV